MSKYWSELAKRLEPYVPGEQPKDKKYIKLNTNENPYPPSPKVLEAIRKASNDDLRLYPDPDCDLLREAASDYYGLKKEQIFAGNGSDELLAFAFAAFFDNGNPVFFPDITYTFYEVYCNFFNITPKLIPLDENFNVPVDEFLKPNGGIVLANPNAPTGKYLDLSAIRKILEHNTERAVIIDEAYIDFGGESAISLINMYPNLMIMHTLSKSRSLAGLRVGFALGSEEMIEGIKRVKNSFNSYTVDRIAMAAASEAMKDREYFDKTRNMVIQTREKTTEKLIKMGFNVLPSKANFIFVSHPVYQGAQLYRELRNKGILVRYFNKPRIDNFLRITIGTDEDMNALINALDNIIN
mgnify:CR=1 FL=1